MRASGFTLICFTSAIIIAWCAEGEEYPVGTQQEKNGMNVAAVYLQPIEMEPADIMLSAADSDVHLEADIKAARTNKNGFAQGDWVPYLTLGYELTKLDGNQTRKGTFMPMVANDGLHHGDNVKMMGSGKYRLLLTIAPPSENQYISFWVPGAAYL